MGIKEINVTIPKLLVIIGEQASGKSTLAKLIYFFQTIQEDLFNLSYRKIDAPHIHEFFLHDFVKEKFYNFFGSTEFWEPFEVRYFYGADKVITLVTSEEYKLLEVQLSPTLEQLFVENYNQLLKNTSSDFTGLLRIPATKALLDMNQRNSYLSQVFEQKHVHSLYTIAGRNATVSYSDLFSKYLFSSLERTLEEGKAAKPLAKKQNTDEFLMLEFIKHVDGIKEFLAGTGGIGEIVETHADNKALEIANQKIERILKGKYRQNIMGEYIKIEGGTSQVLLKNASSGQQESIRILQDLFLIIAEERPVMRVFEEPEAHLFPIAQKNMIELMALMLNSVKHSNIIITTHSPYILSVINNLLFAGQVAAKNSNKKAKVKEVIKEEFWLQPEEVSAYSLGNSYDSSKDYFEDIFNEETGTIDQNYLDTVSEMLGEEFYKLIEINNQ